MAHSNSAYTPLDSGYNHLLLPKTSASALSPAHFSGKCAADSDRLARSHWRTWPLDDRANQMPLYTPLPPLAPASPDLWATSARSYTLEHNWDVATLAHQLPRSPDDESLSEAAEASVTLGPQSASPVPAVAHEIAHDPSALASLIHSDPLLDTSVSSASVYFCLLDAHAPAHFDSLLPLYAVESTHIAPRPAT